MTNEARRERSGSVGDNAVTSAGGTLLAYNTIFEDGTLLVGGGAFPAA